MKKQFFRVKQLADQTFLRANKSEVLNQEELQLADQRVEYLRTALSAIIKKIPSPGQSNDIEKRAKKCLEHHLSAVFSEQSRKLDLGGFEDDGGLFETVVRESGRIEQDLAQQYGEHEKKIEDLVSTPIQGLLDNEFPNILKQKRNLSKYILDKDSASNRYNSTKKEALKDDMEEADIKVEQSRDALAYEMFTLLAQENELSAYILQILKCQKAYHDSALKYLDEVIPGLEKKIGDSPLKRVYGIPLHEHLRVTRKRIAYPLEIIITILSKYGMSEEGLFRLAGSVSRVKRLKGSIDSGCFAANNRLTEYHDLHVLASALKMYLRELPEPLLTSTLYTDWMQLAHQPDHKKVDFVRALLAKLPQENRENLTYLIQFLGKLSRNPENKMTSSNIAIVMSPNLLWDKQETNINMGNCATVNSLVELFIKEVDVLFPEDLSKLVCVSIGSHDDEFSSTRSLAGNDSDCITDSPRPVSRNKRKPAAPPVPPTSKTDQDVNLSERNCLSESYPSGSSTLNRKPKSSIGVNTEITRPVIHTVDTHTPLVNLDSTKTVDHKVVTQPPIAVQVSKAKPVESACAQTTDCDNNKHFTTVVTHVIPNVNVNVNSKPVAAPRALDALSRTPSMRSDVMSKSAGELSESEVQLRKPEVAAKPSIPLRPASLQKRGSGEILDLVHKCSVYNTPGKQQASFVTVRNEPLGHDNQISEKERFLGHQAGPRASLQNKFSDINSNEDSESNKVNGNQKPSHVRTRSDGNLIELSGSKTPPSPRSLNKPTQPPPPPPVARKEPDSTDL